ncbi:MAG: 4-hydroxythreonine-4-phosphate dehydrogenase PdxA, partial [Candidatus Gastranaerophilales bacterium]|nr:4-hydroxythreonine-4-phosphate dehydrogenase PdxA [Candidatus Gastranaerophilales bacterium]
MKKYKIAITTGDKLGIGKEITKKALDYLKLPKDDVLIIGEKVSDFYDTREINIKNNGEFCYQTLFYAAEYAKQGIINAIVTAPVSKNELHKAGHIFNGQTEVLENLLQHDNQKAQMLFIADN